MFTTSRNLDGQVFHRHRGRAHAGVVEQHVEPAEGALHLGKHVLDVGVLGDVGGQHQRAVLGARFRRSLHQHVLAPADQADVIAVLQERKRR
jgi:hypothetical protein